MGMDFKRKTLQAEGQMHPSADSDAHRNGGQPLRMPPWLGPVGRASGSAPQCSCLSGAHEGQQPDSSYSDAGAEEAEAL